MRPTKSWNSDRLISPLPPLPATEKHALVWEPTKRGKGGLGKTSGVGEKDRAGPVQKLGEMVKATQNKQTCFWKEVTANALIA